MKNNTYFISDIHLGLESQQFEAEKERQLVGFLNSIKSDAKTLFIVGDLFDYWFEYRRVHQRGHFRLFSALADLVTSGTEIHYIIGNHDFMHRDFFSKEIGVVLHEKPISMEIDGNKFFIAHGDGLVAKDFGYKVLKFILRNKFFQFLYSLVHPDLGIWIASSSSKSSRAYTSQKNYGRVDSLSIAAQKYIDLNYDYVIFGHSHRKCFQEYKNGVYVNLGTWLNKPCYGIFSNNKFEMIDWNIDG